MYLDIAAVALFLARRLAFLFAASDKEASEGDCRSSGALCDTCRWSQDVVTVLFKTCSGSGRALQVQRTLLDR